MLLQYGNHIPAATLMLLKLYKEEQQDLFIIIIYHIHTSVSNIIANLGWSTLLNRRNDLRLIMLFKIVHNLVDLDPRGIVVLCPSDYDTRGHHLWFFQVPTRVNAFKYSFLHSQSNYGTLFQIIYHMTQNFDGENFDEWASGKIWRKKFDEFHKINAHIY